MCLLGHTVVAVLISIRISMAAFLCIYFVLALVFSRCQLSMRDGQNNAKGNSFWTTRPVCFFVGAWQFLRVKLCYCYVMFFFL